MPDYWKDPNKPYGIIYGIIDIRTGEIIYIGRTKYKAAQRFAGHKSHTNTTVSKFINSEGCHNFNITILKTCNDYNDYWSSEMPMIKLYKPKCNVIGQT